MTTKLESLYAFRLSSLMFPSYLQTNKHKNILKSGEFWELCSFIINKEKR